jgi:signal transduction histidine kinase
MLRAYHGILTSVLQVHPTQPATFSADRIVDSLSQAVIATDTEGRITCWNRTAENLYGKPAATVMGKLLGHVLRKSELPKLFDAIRCGISPTITRRVERDDGVLILTASAVRDDEENICGFVVVSTRLDQQQAPGMNDSERLRLENRLLQAERISSLGRLAASVAHEFNNVLMGIQPFVDLLTRRAGDDPVVKMAAPRIADAVARGKRVTQEILRFTRISEPSRLPINVADWLQSFEPEIAQLAGPDVAVTTQAPPALMMLADPHQLRQVFANLVVNARDAMPDGGRLEIRAAGESQPGVDAPEIVHFTIRDTGLGMSQDTLRYVFEPLFTTKKVGGTGLGLAIAAQVVQQHQGNIYATSVPGVGTTFHILIPATRPRVGVVQAERQALPHNSALHAGMHVMLIEDDESVGVGLAAILDSEGISVDWVRLGNQAVDRIASVVPDAVILDVGLPDIDGMQLYGSIAARWPDLPVLFSTGHGDEKLLMDGSVGNRTAYLQKPYDTDALLAALDDLLAS